MMRLVNMMLIFHEIGETIIGDVPMIDKRNHSKKANAEHKAWRKLLHGLPYEQKVYGLLMEFDQRKTPEAKYAYRIDKLDATKTMKRYYDEHRFHRLAWSIMHSKMISENDDIQRLVKNGAKNAVDIWFADEYAPYDGDEFFMAAHNMLRTMNTNIKPEDI